MTGMSIAHKDLMNKTYGWMKYVYDVSRPFFLFGRSDVRRRVVVLEPVRVLEVGCGTARNLIVMARSLKGIEFHGIDISSEMISYARTRVYKSGYGDQITLFELELDGYLDLMAGEPTPDAVIFSYCLSMIPDWRGVLRSAAGALKTRGGTILITDFHDTANWPRWAMRRLHKNLAHFHVTPRLELVSFLNSDPAFAGWSLAVKSLAAGAAIVVEATAPVTGRLSKVSES